MRSQYAGVGVTCPAWAVQVLSGGNFSAGGTLYFMFQLQNRAGCNVGTVSSAVTYTAGQQIVITIPSTVQQAAWDIQYYILSASTSSDPTTMVQIARLAGYQYGAGVNPQSVQTVLPATITLSRDLHLALAQTVAAPANLPTGSDLLDGQIRWITSLAGFFEYQADSTATPSSTVLGTAGTFGRWVQVGSANTNVTNTVAEGSDRDITYINPVTVVQPPSYPVSTSKQLPTWKEFFWIYNDTDYAITAGTQFGIDIFYNGLKSPDLLNGLFQIEFLGYAQTSGSIRTTSNSTGQTFDNLGGFIDWQPQITAPFYLSDDLQPNEAIAIAVRPYFAAAELNNQITGGSDFGIYPGLRTQSGDYNPIGFLLPGGIIFDIGDKYRAVPSSIPLAIDILAGLPLVGNYNPAPRQRRTIPGLSASTTGQQIVINGNGGVYIEPSSYTLSSSEALRAIVGTAPGETTPGSWSGYQAASNSLVVTLNYPCNSSGYGAIAPNYPDIIAGSTLAKFNPAYVRIYAQRQDTGEIRYFAGTIIAGASQNFTISDWSSGTVVTSLPTSPSASFGLFAPGTAAIASGSTGSGNLAATSYQVCYSFYYDGNQISSISHASPPCIAEWTGNFQPLSIPVFYDSLNNAMVGGSPPPNLGKVGDYYFDDVPGSSTMGNLWIKSGATAWTLFSNLSGPGFYDSVSYPLVAGRPPASLGIVGSYYMDATNTVGNWWKKTDPTTWVLLIGLGGQLNPLLSMFNPTLTSGTVTNGSDSTNQSIQFTTFGTLLVTFAIASGADIPYGSWIQLQRWSQAPNWSAPDYNAAGRQELGNFLMSTGPGNFVVNTEVDSTNQWLSVAVCLPNTGDTDWLKTTISAAFENSILVVTLTGTTS